MENTVKNAFFLGDLFHARFKIDVEVFNAVYSALAKFKDEGIMLWLLAGNHDFAILRRKVSSIGTFEDIAEVILKPRHEIIDGVHFCFLPYCEDTDKFKDMVNFFVKTAPDSQLFCHQGISEAYVRAGVHVREQVSEKDLRHKYFKGVLLGHYHMAQTLTPNVLYVGAVLQHNWGDTGNKRGFIFLQQKEGEELTLKRMETHAPKFVMLQTGWAITKEEVNGNFVKVASKVPMGVLEIEKLKKAIKELGASSVEFDVPVKTRAKKRIDVGLEMSFAKMVEKYVESNVVETKGFNKDKLIKVGKGIVEMSHD
ncbi:hypothetical protein ES703_102018 [subsurface metagenome]